MAATAVVAPRGLGAEEASTPDAPADSRASRNEFMAKISCCSSTASSVDGAARERSGWCGGGVRGSRCRELRQQLRVRPRVGVMVAHGTHATFGRRKKRRKGKKFVLFTGRLLVGSPRRRSCAAAAGIILLPLCLCLPTTISCSSSRRPWPWRRRRPSSTFPVAVQATPTPTPSWKRSSPSSMIPPTRLVLAGFVLTTGVNSAYVLGYSGSLMVPLGWAAGTCGLLLAAAISMYANALLARLHQVGGKRHIRYRDLAGHIYGRKMYALTWALQYFNLFMINTGFVILAGQALKATYALFRDDGALKLPYCISVSGFVCALFAFGIPYLSSLRIWLGVSTVFSLIYIIAAFVLSLKDGMHAPSRDYSIPGDESSRIFATIGAAASLVFAYNTGMLPEIQATVRPPVVKNMEKALWFQFTVGLLPLYAVIFIGYWAYGSSTSSYLLNNVHGPVWVKAVANLSAFLQTVIALHIFTSPMYEYLDTRFGSGRGGPFAVQNVLFRVGVRGGYLTVNTLVAAMLPFLGDFMSLTGALSTFPLTFVLANHMYLVVNRHQLSSLQRSWHWLNVVGFTVLAVAATVAALRLIVVDSSTYHLFADL